MLLTCSYLFSVTECEDSTGSNCSICVWSPAANSNSHLHSQQRRSVDDKNEFKHSQRPGHEGATCVDLGGLRYEVDATWSASNQFALVSHWLLILQLTVT